MTLTEAFGVGLGVTLAGSLICYVVYRVFYIPIVIWLDKKNFFILTHRDTEEIQKGLGDIVIYPLNQRTLFVQVTPKRPVKINEFNMRLVEDAGWFRMPLYQKMAKIMALEFEGTRENPSIKITDDSKGGLHVRMEHPIDRNHDYKIWLKIHIQVDKPWRGLLSIQCNNDRGYRCYGRRAIVFR